MFFFFSVFFLQFSSSLIIICGVNEMTVSKSPLANLMTVLSSKCFHYRASLILTSTVPVVIRVTTGIGQKRVRPFSDLVFLVFKRLLVTGDTCTRSFLSRPSYMHALFCLPATSKLFGYIRSWDVRLLLCMGCSVFDNKFGFTSLRSHGIALNPSFMVFSSKLNPRALNLKEISFVYV